MSHGFPMVEQSAKEPVTAQKFNESSSQQYDSSKVPRPKSSYYFGPPTTTTGFGTPPSGVIGRDRPREIVRVERDYSGGELCQFHPAFPLELEGRISPTLFSETINDINTLIIRAHDPYWGLLDNLVDVMTFYLGSFIFGSKYKREMTKLDKLLVQINATTFNPAGLNILPPARNAWLFLDVEFY